ncbi:hypothetical protein EV426DRAFT_707298 [Tirmania nivea]|nr:hypothetical protein EV426DRAFT_707298 [Tirmania nivea]
MPAKPQLRGPVRRNHERARLPRPPPGNLGAEQQRTQSRVPSSLRLLAPRALPGHSQGIEKTTKRHRSQTTNLSKLEGAFHQHAGGNVPLPLSTFIKGPAAIMLPEYAPGFTTIRTDVQSLSGAEGMNLMRFPEAQKSSLQLSARRSTTSSDFILDEDGLPRMFHCLQNESSVTDRAIQGCPPDCVQSPDGHPAGSAQWQQPTASHLPYSRQESHEPQPSNCAHCPSILCFHFESMMLLDPGQTGQKGMSNLMVSYKNLRHHIDEAHSGVVCDLCADLFCCHLGKLMLLGVDTRELPDLKIHLGQSFMTFRDHIRRLTVGIRGHSIEDYDKTWNITSPRRFIWVYILSIALIKGIGGGTRYMTSHWSLKDMVLFIDYLVEIDRIFRFSGYTSLKYCGKISGGGGGGFPWVLF